MLCLEQEIEQLNVSPARSSVTKATAKVTAVTTVTASTHAHTSIATAPTTKSAPTSPQHCLDPQTSDVSYRDGTQRGFFEGLLGCLRPVWTIIGKATQAELKQQGT